MAIETTDVQPLHCESAIRDGNRRVSDDRFIFVKVEKTMTKEKVPLRNGSSSSLKKIIYTHFNIHYIHRQKIWGRNRYYMNLGT